MIGTYSGDSYHGCFCFLRFKRMVQVPSQITPLRPRKHEFDSFFSRELIEEGRTKKLSPALSDRWLLAI